MNAFRAWVSRKPIRASATLLLASGIVLYALAATYSYLEWRVFDAQVARAESSSADASIERSWAFRFAETTVTVDTTLDGESLARTERIASRRVFRSSGWLRERYVSRLVERQSSEPFITRLAAELDSEAAALGLSEDDARLEFYVAAVQSIPYGEVDSEIRLPIEVVASGSGVCTEKSLLLAELLVNRGYSTVLWVLPTQRHVALGVATSGEGYRGSRFAFIEATRLAWIGECDPVYQAAGPIAQDPIQIELGGGGKRYESGAQVEYVLRVLDSARQESEALGPYADYAEVVRDAHAGEYGDRAERSAYAQRIAEWIEANPHRRAEVYARLTAEGANW